jgi:hypothetical protein
MSRLSLPFLQEEALLLPSVSIFHSALHLWGPDSPPICISLEPTCILRAKVLLVNERYLCFYHYRCLRVPLIPSLDEDNAVYCYRHGALRNAAGSSLYDKLVTAHNLAHVDI